MLLHQPPHRRASSSHVDHRTTSPLTTPPRTNMAPNPLVPRPPRPNSLPTQHHLHPHRAPMGRHNLRLVQPTYNRPNHHLRHPLHRLHNQRAPHGFQSDHPSRRRLRAHSSRRIQLRPPQLRPVFHLRLLHPHLLPSHQRRRRKAIRHRHHPPNRSQQRRIPDIRHPNDENRNLYPVFLRLLHPDLHRRRPDHNMARRQPAQRMDRLPTHLRLRHGPRARSCRMRVVMQPDLAPGNIPIGISMTLFAQFFDGALFVSIGNNILNGRLVAYPDAIGIPGFDAGMVVQAGATELRRARRS